jgi:[ribosomal protein S18]-alanine N-acetyltransferase
MTSPAPAGLPGDATATTGLPDGARETAGLPDGVAVGRLRWWHIEQVLPIEADLFGAEQWSAAMFWNELATGHQYLAATGPGDELLGYAGLAVAGDEAWVQNIAVRRDRQGRGLGRVLLAALLRLAGDQPVLLEVAVDNAAAQHLYASFGFEVIGLRKGYYQPSNTDALVMRRERGNGG